MIIQPRYLDKINWGLISSLIAFSMMNYATCGDQLCTNFRTWIQGRLKSLSALISLHFFSIMIHKDRKWAFVSSWNLWSVKQLGLYVFSLLIRHCQSSSSDLLDQIYDEWFRFTLFSNKKSSMKSQVYLCNWYVQACSLLFPR